MKLALATSAALLVLSANFTALASEVVVFTADFESKSIPPEFSAAAPSALTPIQGFADLGRDGYRFGGRFFRHQTATIVTLSLTNLPPHSELDLDFLFAAIDSLDGTGTYPSGDYFRITLDGAELFRESFANALTQQFQSYVPAPGVELARHVDLGFNGPGSWYTDSAYDMSLEPRLHHLPHSASTATFTFVIEGEGVQDLDDESWAFDNVRVIARSAGNPSDLNSDGLVNAQDLALLLAAWGSPGGIADINGDGAVGPADLAELLAAWS